MENKKIILVVCRGNIERSPFAEAVINRELKKRNLDDRFLAVSRGTQGTAVDPIPVKFPNMSFYKNEFRFSKPIISKLKIDITNNVSKPVDRRAASEAALILAVDEKNKIALLQLFPDLKSKIHKLSELTGKDENFEDPENSNGVEKHSNILMGINNTIIDGFEKLLELANSPEKNKI